MSRMPLGSLKVSVPLVLLIAVLITSFCIFVFSLAASHEQVEQDAIDDVTQQMTEATALIESFTTGGDTRNAHLIISHSGASDEHVAVLALVDGSGRVAGASSESVTGATLEALPGLDNEKARHVQASGAGQTFVSGDGSYVYAYYPVQLGSGAGGSGAAQPGLLFMRYDIRNLKEEATATVIQRMFMMTLFSVILFLAIGIFLHFRVTKRAGDLVGIVQQMTAGDLSVRSGMTGDDELSTIGRAFDRMAEKMGKDREHLLVSESRFRRIFENSMMGIALIRPSFVFETVNARFSAMVGYSPEELASKTLSDITHPDSAVDETEAINNLFSGKIPAYRSKKRYVRKDGSDFSASVTISAQIDETGTPTHVIVMIEDITQLESALEQITASEQELRANYEELARTEQALKESERRYRNMYRYAQVGLFETSLKDATVVACNERYCELFGFESISEAIGRDVLGLYASPAERTRVSEILRRQGYIENHLVRFQNRKTGRLFWAKFSARYNHERDIAEGSIVDMTREIEAEERLRESEHRFRETIKLLDEGYYSCTVEGKILDHNLAFNRILGYPPHHDMKGMLLPDFWQKPEERSKYLRELLAAGAVHNFAIDAWTADKRPVVVMANAHLVKNIAGQVLRIDGTFVDITELRKAEDALRAEKEFNRLLLDASPTYYVAIGMDGTTLMMNQALLDVLGYTQAEVAGTDYMTTFVPVEDRENLSRVFDEIIRENKSNINVNRVLARSGKTRLVEWHGRPIQQEGGRSGFFVGVGIDITERREAEDALVQSERHLRKSQEVAHLGSWELDLVHNHLTWSDEVYRIFGLEPQEFGATYEAFLQHVHPDDRATVDTAYTGSITAGKDSYEIEHRVVRAGGEVRSVYEKCDHVRDATGRIVRSVGIVHDITERRIAEEALRESEARFRTFFEKNNAVMMMLDPESGAILDANPAAAVLSGYPQDRLRTMNIAEINRLPPEEIIRMRKGVAAGTIKSFVAPFQRADGEMRMMEVYSSPVRTAGRTYLFSIIHDITERQKAETALIETSRKLLEAQEMAHLGFWTWDVTTGDVEWSDEVYRIFGLDRKTFRPHIDSILKFSPWPEDHDRDKELIRRAIESRTPGSYEQRFLRPDKSTGYYYSTFEGRYDEAGNLVTIVGTILDITERKRAEEALRESETRFRNLVDELPIGVVMTRRDETGEAILYVNRAFSEMTGYPAASIHSFAEWAPLAYPDPGYREEMTAHALRMYDEAVSNITSSPQVVRVTCEDGTEKEVEFRYTDLKVFGFWTLNDITVRRNAERDITRMNEELALQARILSILNRIITTSDRAKNRSDLIRQVLDETLDLMDYDAGGIYLVDPTGETASVACSRNLPEEFVARVGTVSLKKPPYDSLLVLGEPLITNHYEQVSPDFSKKTGFLSVAAIPLYSMSGILGSINVISRKRHTVTDEEKETLQSIGRELGNALGKIAAVEALRESEEKFRLVSEYAPEGIIIQTKGQFAYLNPAASLMFGAQTPADLLEKPVADHFHPEFRDIVKQRIHQLNDARQGVARVEEKILQLDGNPVDIEASAVPVVYRGENGALVFLRDITERKHADEQREALIRELEKKNTELERFTYTVSHDLKSPLITIRGFTGLIEEDLGKGDLAAVKKDLRRITTAADTMQHLLVDLLALSRIGRIISAPEDVPFSTIAREAADLLAGPLEERGIRVKIDKDLPVVSVDHARIREVLVNLLENATKYMGDQKKPQIRIGIRHDGKTPVFFVQDNGMGIDPRYLDRIFNLFEKLNPSIPGTGIGLPIVRRIIEVHGGKIWAESEGVGKGTTICFTLPLAGAGVFDHE